MERLNGSMPMVTETKPANHPMLDTVSQWQPSGKEARNMCRSLLVFSLRFR